MITLANKQQERSVATKEKLIRCAEDLFYKKGFEKTTVKEIVKAAGVAQGTFYLYFETKEEILYKIAEKVLKNLNQYIAALDVENPKFEDIDNVIDSMAKYMEDNPEINRLLHRSNTLEIMKVKVDSEPQWFLLNKVEKWLFNAAKIGLIVEKPPQLYARIIFQIGHELLESASLYHYPDKLEVVKEEVKEIIRRMLAN